MHQSQMTKIAGVDDIINAQTQVVSPGKDELTDPKLMGHQTRDLYNVDILTSKAMIKKYHKQLCSEMDCIWPMECVSL